MTWKTKCPECGTEVDEDATVTVWGMAPVPEGVWEALGQDPPAEPEYRPLSMLVCQACA